MALMTKVRRDRDGQQDGDGTAEPTRDAGVTEWPSPAKPSAMLVPTYIREKRAADKTTRQVYYGLLVLALLLVVAVAGAFLASITSKGALDDATYSRDQAQSRVDALSDVAAYYDGLEERRTATVALLSNDVRHADLFDRIVGSFPAGSSLTSYTTTYGTPCAGPNPFEAETVIGCVAVTAQVETRSQVADVVDDLNSDPDTGLIANAFVTDITVGEEEGGGTVVALNVNFTPAAFSAKYLPKGEEPPLPVAIDPATGQPVDPGTVPAPTEGLQ